MADDIVTVYRTYLEDHDDERWIISRRWADQWPSGDPVARDQETLNYIVKEKP